MTSTVVDAALCLLLVSAAAVTLTDVGSPAPQPDRADAVASTLAASTATVEYTLAPDHEACRNNPECARRTTATLSELLATATVRSASVDGRQLSRAQADYRRAVRSAVSAAIPPRTQVVARWDPYPDAHVGATVSVGPTPPSDATVTAATLAVPSGVGNAPSLSSLPAALIDGLFPPEKLRLALAGDPPYATLAAERYRRAGRAYGVDLEDELADGDAAAANDALTEAVAARVARETHDRDLDRADIRLDTVRIVVRTWGPPPDGDGDDEADSGGAGR